ncbi:TPA: hypothetical protein ACOFB9_000721 [Stenotrophomonas maltophilia]|uniref:hypothetical protein n=1 Tax=Stenotrophomonas maltophilia TaxID=40324 RepID=UPI002ACCCCA2|nr:hypothetical protein [Stenotrophomonas maltophilia]MDZ5777644.1 hypothetical protein [Stenotrophomonas maltophilia]
MKITIGSGRVHAGETDAVISPDEYCGGSYACILVHGVEAAGGAIDWMTASPYRWPIVRTVVDQCGLYTISADMGGSSTWGNSILLSRMDEAFAYTQTFSQVKKGKVILVGQSMGGLAMLNWARANKSKVAAVVGVIPVTNMNSAIANGLSTQVAAAYGGSYTDAAYGAQYNPRVYAATLAGIPGQLWVGATDLIANTTDAGAVATAAGTIQMITIPGAHAETTLSGIDLDVMAAFVRANSN